MCVCVWLRLARLCYAKTSLNAICMHWMLHVPGANPTRTRRQRRRQRLRRRHPDDPSVAMMSWTLPATSHPIPTSPCPSPSHLFFTFLCISHWVSHAKVATFDFSVSAAAGNPVPQSQSFHILFSFFFFVLLPTTSNNWKYAAYYFPFSIFHLHFPFVSIHFEIFSRKKPTKASPPQPAKSFIFVC